MQLKIKKYTIVGIALAFCLKKSGNAEQGHRQPLKDPYELRYERDETKLQGRPNQY